jgi:hypothetical protein
VIVDLLVWTAVAGIAMAAVTAAVGGCVLVARQRRADNQARFAPYTPAGRAARWQHTRDDPEATVDFDEGPLPTDQDHLDMRGTNRR